jgi:bifunctional ADP-heptose synthase (sugar kinase/adenylyltransferase)
MCALGAEVTFLTTRGEGPDADELFRTLADDGVDVRCVGEEIRPVFTKARFLVAGQKVFKVDRGVRQPPSAASVSALEEAIAKELADHDALVVSDFGYGLFGPSLSAWIAERSREVGRPYYADVSGSGKASLMKFRGARLTTPTEAELRFALGDPESGLSNLASQYYRESESEGLVITLGNRGALYFAPPSPDRERLTTEYLPALEARPVDHVGAGDTFLAMMTLSDLAGATPAEGLYAASLLAAHKVAHVGNDPVLLDELLASLPKRPELRLSPT